jgi:hypothetical protein
MKPLCPRCSFRQREWRKDRQKYRPTCKLCRIPSSNAERRLRKAWKTTSSSKKTFSNYSKLSLARKVCEACRFKAQHPCQLDVDHKDGNWLNDDSANLQILCANCHRLKTFMKRDWEPREFGRSMMERRGLGP